MKAIKFKRLTIISAALLLHSAAYSQIPKGERPKFPEYIGAFDVKENLSEEEIKAREEEIKARDIRRIAEGMVFVESWLDEAPQPLLNASEAKKAISTYKNNAEIKKLKKQGLYLIAKLTVEKDGSISEIKIFQSDAKELQTEKHVTGIRVISQDNTPNSPWREMTLESAKEKYAWVSTNEKANNAVRSYIKGLKWSVGKLYELPTRTGMYYVLP